MALRGLKPKIAFNIAILVLLSALITDVLVVVVAQRMLIRQEVDRSRQVLNAIGQQILQPAGALDALTQGEPEVATARLTASTNLTTLMVTDVRGTLRYQQEVDPFSVTTLQRDHRRTLQNKHSMVKDVGLVWTGFWWHPRAVIVTVPISSGDQFMGVATGVTALSPIYMLVNRFNKPILFYIIINTLFLTAIGLYRLFKLYLRPIDRIVRQADDYHEDEDLFFAFRQEDNQLNRLSSSLNRMLHRIKADKETLKKTVVSLEQANAALKDAQKKIVQTEKMASVGRLASGIAHEIGNPIGIVLGYLDLLKKDDLDDEEKEDFLHRTEAEVQRINTIIHQLLDLARPKEAHAQHIQLNDLIEDIMAVMRMQPLMSAIRFESQLNLEHPFVWANPDQLRQVFLNLLLNAGDAIQARNESHHEGVITIRTNRQESSDGDATPHVLIRFEDNGIGVDPEHLDNMFDPFFTTKEPGKGTGLGLAVSYMIIEGMGGTLTAESEVGHGCVLTVSLPLAASEHGPEKRS